jgi:O-acetyl-ADP-ribose deacetylase (regulator of RNase III)
MGLAIRLVQGDITKIAVDAICNAANGRLAGGGGVDGAIHRAAGSELREDLDDIVRRQGGCRTGQAVVTRAGRLPARYVFHAVGPVWNGGGQGEAELLASCYRSCLALADGHGVKRISFPAISTGIYRYPVELAAATALEAVRQYATENSTGVEEVLFVLFDARTLEAFQKAYADAFNA